MVVVEVLLSYFIVSYRHPDLALPPPFHLLLSGFFFLFIIVVVLPPVC